MNTMAKPVMDENELSRRRRAIFQALQTYLGGEDIMRALWLWEERFSERPSFELHGFLDAICTTPALKHLRKEIHLALVKHLVRPLPELGPDPWPQMRRYQEHSALPPDRPPASAALAIDEYSAPVAVVFTAVCGRYLALLAARAPQAAANIRAALLTLLTRTTLDGEARSQLVGWLTGRYSNVGAELEAGAARRLLHTAYVLACEYYGPTTADHCLADAVEAAETMAEAKSFSPRKLL
jgi:hypothetical protein